MPVILDRAKAPPLDALLAQVETDGLSHTLEADAIPAIAGMGTLSAAGPDEIAFLANAQYVGQLATTRAGAVILTRAAADAAAAQAAPAYARIICEQPYLLYARLSQWFARHQRAPEPPGIHPSAVVAPDTLIGPDVIIGPGACIEAGASIGAGSRIGAGCVVGTGSVLGEQTLLYPRVTVYAGVRAGDRLIAHAGAVLGADGFGFAPDAMAAARGERGRWVKIAQLGGLNLGDDVEVGANTTIDRGALDDTIIDDGVKLDNQIMIAHNVRVGAHTAMAACVGVAGSTTIGARCTFGGAAMISGHLTLVDDVHISGGTLVAASILQPGRYTAVYPLAEHGEWQRNAGVVSQLAKLRRRVQALERGAGE